MRFVQLAFLVMPLATLAVGGTVSRNAEGLSSLAERQVCPCASQNKICDVTLAPLCCSGVCVAAANAILPNVGTCSCYSSGTACTGDNNCCSGNCVSTNGGPYLCQLWKTKIQFGETGLIHSCDDVHELVIVFTFADSRSIMQRYINWEKSDRYPRAFDRLGNRLSAYDEHSFRKKNCLKSEPHSETGNTVSFEHLDFTHLGLRVPVNFKTFIERSIERLTNRNPSLSVCIRLLSSILTVPVTVAAGGAVDSDIDALYNGRGECRFNLCCGNIGTQTKNDVPETGIQLAQFHGTKPIAKQLVVYGPVLEHDTPSDYGGRDVVAVCLERCLQLLWLVCQTSNFHEQGQTDACHRHPTVAEYHTSDTVTGDCTIAERPIPYSVMPGKGNQKYIDVVIWYFIGVSETNLHLGAGVSGTVEEHFKSSPAP
ncbi:hypothetical protein EDD17DRAFT_1893767 [Pisolithus thermaeus]|nr:hypothetical protein EV401DRAFT_1884578 [Pisolithus croceorrhizus]KAI6166545.1 hypothetical protein EDD17DRAFT_1893767 [Pisolithus thermaeus]